MEYRKESSQWTTASQGTLPPTSSTSTELNVPVPGPTRPVLNYPIQTGEEFALEFMRDRAMSKMPSAPLPVTAHAPSQLPVLPRGYMNLRGIVGVCRTGSENPNQNRAAVTENKPCVSSARPVPAPGPPRAVSRYTSSEVGSTSGSRIVRVLCSYGGLILLRLSDGKLRYVGGGTHIIGINYKITFQELMNKTTSIYNIPHTIKYQIPGEELDVLVSVKNDDDVRSMMDCEALLDGTSKRREGFQKLRMFLFPNTDVDDTSVTPGSTDGDSEVQFPIDIEKQ